MVTNVNQGAQLYADHALRAISRHLRILQKLNADLTCLLLCALRVPNEPSPEPVEGSKGCGR